MFLSTQPYKGTRDFYPEQKALQKSVFSKLSKVVESFGYQEYDGPMLESFEIYAAKTGEEIVSQQLYSFEDRGGRKLAIRPEMTPTLARMVASSLQELPRPIRWYSVPNLWRYERPQRGRLREHWQLNVDLLSPYSPAADFELLELSVALFDAYSLRNKVRIAINHRAFAEEYFKKLLLLDGAKSLALSKLIDTREKMEEAVFLQKCSDLGLNADRQGLLEQLLAAEDPSELAQKYSLASAGPLVGVFEKVREHGLDGVICFDASIMRGMDYYTGLVFEAFDVSPENRRALFGGGRYDNLIGLFGKEGLSGVGLGLGDVSFMNFLETHAALPKVGVGPDFYVAWVDDVPFSQELLAGVRCLRERGFRVLMGLEPHKLSYHLKAATKLDSKAIVIQGSDELAASEIAVKHLSSREQKSFSAANWAEECASLLSSAAQ